MAIAKITKTNSGVFLKLSTMLFHNFNKKFILSKRLISPVSVQNLCKGKKKVAGFIIIY